MRTRQGLVTAWQRWSLRRRQYAGGAEVLDALYDRADPWNLASEEERVRFEATSALILHHCTPVDSLIEIGCGEGLQTQHLARLASHVTGIDVSANALARARTAVLDATLLEGELTALLPSLPRSSYDVATLCEVLYYMADPADALARAQGLARNVIVTLYEPQARRLVPLLQGEGWQEAPPIAAGRKRWKTYVWKRD
ncbi:MAG TPA: class I SAM-dependent methyltransferase [Sphingobium sp.]|uniref:class I SAM-dependent methyltransferase n=1 Tax=Sphingobium sp. TaxID=1912891 RepID=UPI002ED1AE7B